MTIQQTSDRALVGFDRRITESAVADPGALPELNARLAGARRAVVIVGSSISGLVLAGRLAAAAQGRNGLEIVLVVGSPPVPRRLVAGCSLRWSTVHRMARALGVDQAVLTDRLGGPDACFERLAMELFDPRGRTEVAEHLKPGPAMEPYAGLSTRHGAILTALRESLDPALPLTVVDGDVPAGESLDGNELPVRLRDGTGVLKLPSQRSVVLNATPRSELLRPRVAVPEPRRWIVVVQAPLGVDGDDPRCGRSIGWAPLGFGDLAPHLAFFTPFIDPQTPGATWYGINTMSVSGDQLQQHGADNLKEAVSQRLLDLEAELGTREIDPKATRAAAVVPVVRDDGRQTEKQLDDGTPVVDAHRSFTSGAPAINVDGMLAAAVGADSFATAFLGATGDPALAARSALAVSDRALRGIRRRNIIAETANFRGPDAARLALRYLPKRLAANYLDNFSRLGA